MTSDKKIVSLDRLKARLKGSRPASKIVIATGTFDLFHAGHLLFLDFAKKQGDILVVGVGSDRIVKQYKGDQRPILNESFRTRLIAGLQIVDYVIIIDEDPIEKISGRTMFKELRPDIWVVPYRDHNPEGVKQFAKEIGAKLVRNPRRAPGRFGIPLSTTYIISKARAS